MQTFFNIMRRSRFFLGGAAVVFGVIGMAANLDWAYILCLIFIALTITADVIVLMLHKKLDIPIKYHENMYKLKKRK